jgi:hypothetical protein
VFNIGETKNNGLELAINANLITSKKVTWDLGATVATSHDEIVSLGNLGTFAGLGSLQLYSEGYPIGAFFAKRVVSATLVPRANPTPTQTPMVATNVLCDGGPGADPMPCANAPALFIGSPTPKAVGAFTSTVTLFGKLQLYGMVDYKVGQYHYNFDQVTRCGIYSDCEAVWYPEKYDPAYIAEVGLASSTTVASRFIEKTSFARLRELSASYTLPTKWVKALGMSRGVLTVAGRNLHTWTGYTGLDPETRIQPTGGQASQISQAQIPVAAQIITSIRLTF